MKSTVPAATHHFKVLLHTSNADYEICMVKTRSSYIKYKI